MRIISKNGVTIINGNTFTGRSININGNSVIVDGKVVDCNIEKEINVVINGDVEKIELECGRIEAKNVGNIQTKSGDITCDDVSGSISTMSGDVNCEIVHGNIQTMSGDIRSRK